MLMARTSTEAGAEYLQYRPQEMGWPSRAAMEVPATLAEAPMGVALLPMSVPGGEGPARYPGRPPWWPTGR